MEEERDDLVSVLMCVYNTRVEFLQQAVDSILNQTYTNIEFVIVDDASDDYEVLDYLEQLETTNDRIRLFHNERNLGLTRSLNVGLKKCTGKYIARMDSDDISLPERITIQKEYMDNNSDVALVGSDIYRFGDTIQEREIVKSTNDENPEIYKIRSLVQHSGPPHPTFMFRRSFMVDHDIKYREDILKAQDYGIMVDVLKVEGKIRRISAPLLKYRIHGNQITNTSEAEQKAYQCRVSFDFIREVFPTLSLDDCAMISLLGCDFDIRTMFEAISNNTAMGRVCEFLIARTDKASVPGNYITAVKNIIACNKKERKYNTGLFGPLIRNMWWKKAIRTSKSSHRPWGITPYTFWCYFNRIE